MLESDTNRLSRPQVTEQIFVVSQCGQTHDVYSTNSVAGVVVVDAPYLTETRSLLSAPVCGTDSQVTVLKPAVCFMLHCLGREREREREGEGGGSVTRPVMAQCTGRHGQHKPRSWTSAHVMI